jgi:hypothetical protein
MQDNLGGDFKEFQSAYEAVGTDLFDQQEGSLRKLTQTATQYVLKLDGWIQKNKGWRNYRHHCRWRTGADWHDRGIGLLRGRLSWGLTPLSPLLACWVRSLLWPVVPL